MNETVKRELKRREKLKVKLSCCWGSGRGSSPVYNLLYFFAQNRTEQNTDSR